MTKVKFYIEKDGQILAVFPDLIANSKGNLTCYSHIGQHSACSKEYVGGLKLAAPWQANDLLNELKGQGYDDLQVVDSRKAFSRVLESVSCKYGAPMGRDNVGTPPTTKAIKVFDFPVRLEDGYDKGGAYWGWPDNVRVKYTKDLNYIEFYRK